jgi:hypothetical protein
MLKVVTNNHYNARWTTVLHTPRFDTEAVIAIATLTQAVLIDPDALRFEYVEFMATTSEAQAYKLGGLREDGKPYSVNKQAHLDLVELYQKKVLGLSNVEIAAVIRPKKQEVQFFQHGNGGSWSMLITKPGRGKTICAQGGKLLIAAAS